jgi:uncharacterized membrane protein YraQ (UPF0718 family)/copper chaperone CopZ
VEFLIEIGAAFWVVLADMAPYLLFGFIVAGALAVWIPQESVERHLGGSGLGSVLKATVLGIPLPLCSCGVIPVAASLRRHGAGRAPATAFLISTPQTGVDSFLVSFSLLGPVIALFRVAAALVSGVIGGLVVGRIGGEGSDETSPPACAAACCASHGHPGRIQRALRYGFVTLPDDIGPALLVGLLAAGGVAVLVPDAFFASLLGGGIGAMGIMLLAGVPMYVCATASVPLAAALMAKGVSPGAALVFLMTGPATNMAAVTTLWKMMGRRSALAYLAVVGVTALASGLALDALFSAASLGITQGTVEELLPGVVHTLSAAVLVGILASSLLRAARRHLGDRSAAAVAKPLLLKVGGMRCHVCGTRVRRALGGEAGVDSVDEDLENGAAVVRGKNLDVPSLRRNLEELGFTAGEGGEPPGIPGHERHGEEGDPGTSEEGTHV